MRQGRLWALLRNTGIGFYLIGLALAQLFILNGDRSLDPQIAAGVVLLTLGGLMVMAGYRLR